MRIKHLLALALLCPIFTSCDAFENKGDIADYVGNYVITACHEKTYHVSWGSKKLISEKEIQPGTGVQIIIKEDYSVAYTAKDGSKTTGKVKCLENYCRFTNTPIDSSYKFQRYKYDKNLHYSWESTHMSAEYDVTYRTITLEKQS